MITFMQAAQGGGMPVLLMLAAICAITWFFMIRPQQKKQKEIQRFRDAITTGTSVVTAGGIYGVVRRIDETENILHIEVANGVNIRVDRNSVYANAQAPVAK
ncbi:MAG: preprotein translocase subunit YajC [Bacteroidaceae bacterium]|nr:preprotein translocase subunit YajC [Bacteroidaceae bacterium]